MLLLVMSSCQNHPAFDLFCVYTECGKSLGEGANFQFCREPQNCVLGIIKQREQFVHVYSCQQCWEICHTRESHLKSLVQESCMLRSHVQNTFRSEDIYIIISKSFLSLMLLLTSCNTEQFCIIIRDRL